MGCKRRAESRWWGHRPVDFSNLPVSTDNCVGEHESIASVMSGPNFSLLGDESESVCADSANPSRGESNLGHANIALDVRVLPDKGVDDNTKLKGEATMAEHCSVDENTKLKGEAIMAEHCSDDENTKLKGKEKMAKHCSVNENVSTKRKFVADTSNTPCESIPQTTSETIRQNPDKLVVNENLPPILVQGRVLLNLLMRQVHDNENEVLHFLVNGAKLRFGLGEFALITGLKCKVVHLLRPKFEPYFHLVETGDSNGYPWGIDVFHATFESCSNKFKSKPGFYRYSEFPLALQIWLYECCPELKGRFAEHSGSEVPCILNWSIEKQLSHEYICLRMFSLHPDQVSNILPSANERTLLELDGLTFESPYMGSQSQRLSDGFFCTQAPKVDIGKSSFVDGASTNDDLKKELNDFRLHVDVKFGEILEALCHLTKKLEEKKSNEYCYSGCGDTVFPDLGMDADEDAYKVAPDNTPNVCEVGVGVRILT
ncbi:hypothetical protein HAX54_007594 [Datura stramonium]|uniref:DUF1985 domain-containing protein n=1 Tax=Datura stramonium TaxID=4076 RepID=A0ABS8RXA1_DATST|nr:hypothetical protein [Datura stramonium]